MVDLAKLAEVDVSTVSRALKDSPRVKESTRRHIQQLARRNGFVVNAMGSNLRRRSFRSVGLVVRLDRADGQTMADPFYLEMLSSIAEALSERGYDFIVNLPDRDNPDIEREIVQSGRAEGLILMGSADEVDRLNALHEAGIRFVVWGAHLPGATYPVIGSDNEKGGFLAASHLLERGSRQLLFIGDPDLPEIAARYAGFQRAHRDSGVSPPPHHLVRAHFGGRSVGDDVLALARSGQSFDGICATSDVLAERAIQALATEGTSVPDDVRVVGYDDTRQASMVRPPLTTISQSIADGGRLMVELLIGIADPDHQASRYTDTTLVVRDSC